MAEEGPPPQIDPCQHLRDELIRLEADIGATRELIDSGELTPDLEEELREHLSRLEARSAHVLRQWEECKQEA